MPQKLQKTKERLHKTPLFSETFLSQWRKFSLAPEIPRFSRDPLPILIILSPSLACCLMDAWERRKIGKLFSEKFSSLSSSGYFFRNCFLSGIERVRERSSKLVVGGSKSPHFRHFLFLFFSTNSSNCAKKKQRNKKIALTYRKISENFNSNEMFLLENLKTFATGGENILSARKSSSRPL